MHSSTNDAAHKRSAVLSCPAHATPHSFCAILYPHHDVHNVQCRKNSSSVLPRTALPQHIYQRKHTAWTAELQTNQSHPPRPPGTGRGTSNASICDDLHRSWIMMPCILPATFVQKALEACSALAAGQQCSHLKSVRTSIHSMHTVCRTHSPSSSRTRSSTQYHARKMPAWHGCLVPASRSSAFCCWPRPVSYRWGWR